MFLVNEGLADSTASADDVPDASKKSDVDADSALSNATEEAEMTPTKKAARTFSQLESESAATPVNETDS